MNNLKSFNINGIDVSINANAILYNDSSTSLNAVDVQSAIEKTSDKLEDIRITNNIELSYQQGSFNNDGTDVTSTTEYRSQKIYTNLDVWLEYDATIYNVVMNIYQNSYTIRRNINIIPYTLYNNIGSFIRIAVSRIDGADLDTTELDTIIIHVTSLEELKENIDIVNNKILRIDSFGGWEYSKTHGVNIGDIVYLESNGHLYKRVSTDTNDVASIKSIYNTITSRNSVYIYNNTLYVYNDDGFLVKAIADTEDDNYGSKIEITDWEQGTFNGNGEDVEITTAYRSPKISAKPGDKILLLLNPKYKYAINISDDNGTRYNISNVCFSVGCTINDSDDFIRVVVKNIDDTLPDMTEVGSLYYVIFKSKSAEYDVVIAASDSTEADKNKADIICSGEDDCRIINAAVNCHLNKVRILLLKGTYNLNEIIPCKTNGLQYSNDCCILDYTTLGSYKKSTTIEGDGVATPGHLSVTKLITSGEVETNSTPVSLIRANDYNKTTNATSISYGYHILTMKNLKITTDCSVNPIIAIDGIMYSAMSIDNIRIYGNKSESTSVFSYIPAEGSVGIRGLQGSNNGIYDRIQSVACVYFYKGFDIGGEHFILEDCLAHHNYYGFAFGDYECKIQLEHPNMMIGCSAEQNFYFMKLGRYGCTTEEELETLGKSSQTQTLICIGLSTETTFETSGLSELGYTDGWHQMGGIKEDFPGLWRGTIELDYIWKLFEDSQGETFTQRMYHLPICGEKAVWLTYGEQTYLHRFFIVSENRWITNIVQNGNTWVYDDGTACNLTN